MKTTTFLMTLLLLDVSADAQLRFQKRIYTSGSQWAFAIQRTTDGGYITGGETNGFGSGAHDGFLAKTDSAGNISWVKSYGGSSYDWVNDVVQTPDGGYMACGGTESSGGLTDWWIFRTDASGNLLWQRKSGGVEYDYCYEIKPCLDGDYVVVGYQGVTQGTFTYDLACLMKVDTSGTIEWIRHYENVNVHTYANTVEQAADSGFMIGGFVYSFGTFTALIIRTNSTGAASWAKTYYANDGWVNTITRRPDGKFAIAGCLNVPTYYNVWLALLNNDGSMNWSYSYDGPGSSLEDVYGISTTTDGGYIMSGITNSFSLDEEALLLKTDSAGVLQWAYRFGGSGDDEFNNPVTNPGNEGYTLAANFDHDSSVYLIKCDTGGVSGCNQTAANFTRYSNNLVSTSFIVTDSTVSARDTSAFSMVTASMNVQSICFSTGLPIVTAEDAIVVFPNPVSTELMISFGALQIHEIEIADLSGRTFFHDVISLQETDYRYDAGNLQSGIYLVKMSDGEKQYVRKIVVY